MKEPNQELYTLLYQTMLCSLVCQYVLTHQAALILIFPNSRPTGACSGSHRHVPGPFGVLLQIRSSNARCAASKSEQLCAQRTLLALQMLAKVPLTASTRAA
jgi:hypothetical protein